MPRKKRSRVPSRARPVIPDDSLVEPDMEADQRKEKLRLLLEDFDHEGWCYICLAHELNSLIMFYASGI